MSFKAPKPINQYKNKRKALYMEGFSIRKCTDMERMFSSG